MGVFKDQAQKITYDYCGDPNLIDLTKECTQKLLNEKALRAVFQRDCHSQKSCNLDFNKFRPKVPIEDDSPTPEYCKGQFATYYIQYDCHLEDDYKLTGLLIAFIGTMSCLIFNFLIYYLQCSAELNFDFWDSLTITTSDFTCQITINEAVWQSWKQQARKDGVKLDKFKTYLQEEIEK